MPTATATKDAKATVDPHRDAIMATLAKLGAGSVKDEDLAFEGTKFILPAHFGGDVKPAIEYLRQWDKRQTEKFCFTRTFPFRPWDGAAAFERSMRRVFGTAGIAQPIQSFFGEEPPRMVSIAIGPHEQLQVPWGHIAFSPLNALFVLDAQNTTEQGLIFSVTVNAPLRYRAQIEGFFQILEEELKLRSIYKGKAFEGTEEPVFKDTSLTDPSRVVYSEDVQTQLSTNMWSLLRHSDAMRRNGITLKRSILVEGPYGVGKTLAGDLTAKEAVENGWTFILARPGKDDLADVLKMAALYAPAVVWYEDIDVVAKGTSAVQMSQLLDALDGMSAKGVEIMAGFTTNFAHLIQKGVMRPGRLDAVIHIGELDDAGLEKLCRVTIPGERQGQIDYAKIADAFDGALRLPAFVAEAISRAMRYSIARNHGELDVIETDDLVHAANGLRPQLELMEAANEGVRVAELDKALKELVGSTVDGSALVNEYDDMVGKLVVPAGK